MLERGYDREFAERIFKQLEGFGSYGFPESHAASFALIAYASSWMKCHHPDVFCCALLNAQPMGFYAPAQTRARCTAAWRRDPAGRHQPFPMGLHAGSDGGDGFAVRLGLRMAKGLANAEGARDRAHARRDAFESIEDIWRRAGVSVAALERLAEADAFGSIGLNSRDALWQIKGLGDVPLPLFAAADDRERRLRPESVEPAVRARAHDPGS